MFCLPTGKDFVCNFVRAVWQKFFFFACLENGWFATLETLEHEICRLENQFHKHPKSSHQKFGQSHPKKQKLFADFENGPWWVFLHFIPASKKQQNGQERRDKKTRSINVLPFEVKPGEEKAQDLTVGRWGGGATSCLV